MKRKITDLFLGITKKGWRILRIEQSIEDTERKEQSDLISELIKGSIEELSHRIDKLAELISYEHKGLEEGDLNHLNLIRGLLQRQEANLGRELVEIGRLTEGYQKIIDSLMYDLIEVMDNFERIESNRPLFPSNYVTLYKWTEGLLLIKEHLRQILSRQKIVSFSSLGERYDPSRHEVIEKVVREDMERGLVVEELGRGYKMEDKIIVRAKVIISTRGETFMPRN